MSHTSSHGREFASVEEVDAAIQDPSTGLQQRLIEEVGRFTVALLPISLAGTLVKGATGTLVSLQDSHYILTAAHVAERLKCRSTARVAITLRALIDHRCFLQKEHMMQFGPPKPAEWNEWGPDIALLCIPTFDAKRIEAEGRGAFLNLSKERILPLGPGKYTQCRIQMGVPAALSSYTDLHADLCLNGTILSVGDKPALEHNGFDYIDLDFSFHPAHPHLGGVSGGGLWRLLFYKDVATGSIESLKVLEGVAYYGIESTLRCHGPRSIGNALHSLFQDRE